MKLEMRSILACALCIPLIFVAVSVGVSLYSHYCTSKINFKIHRYEGFIDGSRPFNVHVATPHENPSKVIFIHRYYYPKTVKQFSSYRHTGGFSIMGIYESSAYYATDRLPLPSDKFTYIETERLSDPMHPKILKTEKLDYPFDIVHAFYNDENRQDYSFESLQKYASAYSK